MLNIRRANESEFEVMTSIAIRSESYWDFGDDYMEKFKAMYNVSQDFIKNNPTFVLEDDNEILGFYGVRMGENETELEYMFIEPKHIGKGYGRMLWNHMVEECEKLDIEEITLITSPQAKGFYTKLGAVVIDELDCQLIKGRKIPKLKYKIK